MQYEAQQSRNHPDEWVVEAINHDGEGEIYAILFNGPDAEQRAKEYAAWKNATGDPCHGCEMPIGTTQGASVYRLTPVTVAVEGERTETVLLCDTCFGSAMDVLVQLLPPEQAQQWLRAVRGGMLAK